MDYQTGRAGIAVALVAGTALALGACKPSPGPGPGKGEMDGFVYLDSDNDQAVDALELRFPNAGGATVELYFDTNGNGSLDLGVDAQVAQPTPYGMPSSSGHFNLKATQAGVHFARVTGVANPALSPNPSGAIMMDLTDNHGAHADFRFGP